MAEAAHKTGRKLHKAVKPHKRRTPASGHDVWVRYMKDLHSGKFRGGPNHKAEAEKLVKDAERAEERKNLARASVLHEKAGDLFRICRTMEDYGPLVAPAGSGTVSSTWSAALPERVEPVMGRTMYEEAIKQYGLAADLVRETNPQRAKMLESKISIAQSRLHDEEDGIMPDG